MLSLILRWVGVTVVVAVGLGYAASVSRRSPSAVGDAELGRLCSRRTRRLAASVVDLRDHPSARSAFIRCSAATRFEIDSVTKTLTGLLLADVVADTARPNETERVATALARWLARGRRDLGGSAVCYHHSAGTGALFEGEVLNADECIGVEAALRAVTIDGAWPGRHATHAEAPARKVLIGPVVIPKVPLLGLKSPGLLSELGRRSR